MEILVKNIVLKSNEDIEIGFLYELGPIYEQLKEKNIKITLFNDTSNIFNISRKIIKYCKNQNIDIINVHDGGLKSLLIYYIILKTTKIKVVRTVHSEEIEAIKISTNNKLKEKITYMFMKLTMKLSSKVVCVSNAVENSLKDKFSLNNTVTIYNGIEEERIVENKMSGFNNKMVFCGRLSKVKGVDILINALKILNETKKYYLELIIVGDGEERERLEKMCSEYQLVDNIKFEGFQNDIWKFLDNSSIFIYPVTCNEAFGISIVEAMARGCIPIASKRGGIGEIISNCENGFLIDELSAESLAKTIANVYELEKEEKERISKNAVLTAKKYTINNIVKSLEKEYRKL